MTFDKSISFKTERFDYSSVLPNEYNAGNRFYGKDAAAYLCEQLTAVGLAANYLDEDWGWLLEGDWAPSTTFEIATYNINDHGDGNRPGAPEWGLWIRAFQQAKVWGVFPKKTQVAVPEVVIAAVNGAITALGSVPEVWADGPGG